MKAKLKDLYWILVELFIAIIYIPIDYFRELFNLNSNQK
jgi:hypothetical protein